MTPREGQRVYRADLGMQFEWDGLQWVSVREIAIPEWLRPAVTPRMLIGSDGAHRWIGKLARRQRR